MSSGPNKTSEASEEKWKKIGTLEKEPRHGLSILKNSTLIFSCLPIYVIVSLFRVSLLWGERLFTEGLLPICWDNKSSSKLRDVALYMCGHMIKPHYLLSSKMKVASLLFSNTNIDFQRISLHRLPVAKSSLSKPGKCILFSYSLHSAVKKKKNITKLTWMSYFTPWSNFWRKNSLIPSALFLFQIFVKAMQLGCTLILITALVT